MTDIQTSLFEMKDNKYKSFQCALMPTVSRDAVIGARTPLLRAMSKELYGTAEACRFMRELPHAYYEENNLHAFLIERISDFDECISALDIFLPFVDNWATCDSMTPRCLIKRPEALLKKIGEWLKSEHTYTVRFAIKMLMTFFLDERFDESYLDAVASLRSDEYYVNMMIAWYFATALAKQEKSTLPYFEQAKLAPWIHNKAIQKALESYRISDNLKHSLRAIKTKQSSQM